MKQIKAIPKLVFDKHFTDKEFKYYDYACFISILDIDNNEQKFDKSIDNFLQVKMWDIEEDLFENGELKYEKPNDNELKMIVDFVNKHKDKSVFMVHCSAGISRSGAVATFLYDKFFTEIDKEQFRRENKYIRPNLYILNRLKSLDTAIAQNRCYAQVFSRLFFGDCLIESDKIESGSVDLILTDLPYGTVTNIASSDTVKHGMQNKTNWDCVIETEKIYEIANRILRKNGKMVLFAQQPFTTELISKQVANVPFNYCMIWKKDHFANSLIAKKAPLNYYEDVLMFSKNHQKHDFKGIHPLRPYFKIVMDFIGLNIKQINTKLGHRKAEHTFYINSTQFLLCTEKTYIELIEIFGIDKSDGFKPFVELKQIDTEYRTDLLKQMNEQFPSTFNLWEGNKYKSNILKYKKDYNGYHPTQKPVLLLEDLIKTFSNENDLVCDLTMGSGSTGVACKNTNRSFIGIEKDEQYFKIAEQRINARTLFS